MAAGSSSPTDSSTDSPTDDGPAPTGRGSRTGWTVLCAVAALILAANLFGGRDPSSDASSAAASDTSRPPRTTQAGPSASPAGHPAGRHLPRARPLRLIIPKISVDAPFTPLNIGRSGQLEAPPADDVNLVGWHAEGATPGERGTAIIAGHVDTATSPAVFAELGELEAGDTFRVTRADRRTARFVVDSVETFDKKHFPDRRVYADTPRAQVRLITCAGDYDHSAKDYTENLVVFAHLV
ncbi:class F sortase [Streptomyces sp. NL15-2K]|uniref:class F sortase n=1 Tax=Streptomyces sp. NL15-2K TaxID=376149 RepID=UPI000F57A44F|nr:MULTISPECIES: class F sortase [Actinomycetes]WKX06368.1 class F sortase [Kutzneria buriramensis]GCB43364.1 secreted protein [Streptomyces sp. NL15-2K]